MIHVTNCSVSFTEKFYFKIISLLIYNVDGGSQVVEEFKTAFCACVHKGQGTKGTIVLDKTIFFKACNETKEKKSTRMMMNLCKCPDLFDDGTANDFVQMDEA